VTELHHTFAWVVVITNGAAGGWVAAAHWVEQLRVKSMWWAVHIAHGTVAAQVMLGAYLIGVNDIEASGIHTFYGFLCFVAVTVIVAYRHLAQYRYLLYGLGSLFIMGLAIRAMTLPALG